MKRANLRLFEETLRRKRLFLFNAADISRLFGWSNTAVRFLLHRYTKRGITIRLKRDIYTLAGAYVPENYVANRLYEPSYVSLESALSFHGVIPETVYAVTSITTKKTRRLSAMKRDYIYHHIKPKAFTGYAPVKQGEFTSLIADPEKALVDYHYMVLRGQRRPFDVDRARLGKLRLGIIEKYIRAFGDPRLRKLLKEVLEKRNIFL